MRITAICAKDTAARHVPSVISVDMGFSSSRASCGVAWKGFLAIRQDGAEELTFGGAVEHIVELLRATSGDVVLIVEAPLSGAFNSEGSPVPRGDFERFDSQTGTRNPRYWFAGAGAATALAAAYFMETLARQATNFRPESSLKVVEGFASRYAAEPPTHQQVARALLEGWQDQSIPLLDPEGDSLISVLKLVGNTDSTPPSILRMPDGMAA